MIKHAHKSILLPFLATLFLFGCSHSTVTEKVAQNANKTISEIQADLPIECKNQIVNEKFEHAKAEIETIVASCSLEKKETEAQRDKWKIMFTMTMMVIGIYLFMKLRSKL